jgi:alkanesulfonate monooxygenase SsuD/methylene tetrahydromethanopterin reductase-like flavin-dependent oxidoreductase (luciferase family)
MKFDLFFSICQTPVDAYMPSERVMFQNFFSQVKLADELGYTTAWVAETHLSCQVQKENPQAVIPHFEGEIGLNTDILQLAHIVFGKTKHIHIGSAIRNIICNGGPIAHAEAIKTFLSYHSLDEKESRRLEIGFASGRFPFSNRPYGFYPRNELEIAAWPVLKTKIFQEATEIFLRLLRGDILASKDIRPKKLQAKDFRTAEDWEKIVKIHGTKTEEILIPSTWSFDKVGVIPFEAPLDLLRLTIGCHDTETQVLANEFYPVGVFNLSITPTPQIEKTHEIMKKAFHKSGGAWSRDLMPRTVLVFLENTEAKAKEKAKKALETYWKAIEGTLDPQKIANAVDNALVGTAEMIAEQLKTRFHRDDRLMLWFDFNNHDTKDVERAMRSFMEDVVPRI